MNILKKLFLLIVVINAVLPVFAMEGTPPGYINRENAKKYGSRFFQHDEKLLKEVDKRIEGEFENLGLKFISKDLVLEVISKLQEEEEKKVEEEGFEEQQKESIVSRDHPGDSITIQAAINLAKERGLSEVAIKEFKRKLEKIQFDKDDVEAFIKEALEEQKKKPAVPQEESKEKEEDVGGGYSITIDEAIKNAEKAGIFGDKLIELRGNLEQGAQNRKVSWQEASRLIKQAQLQQSQQFDRVPEKPQGERKRSSSQFIETSPDYYRNQQGLIDNSIHGKVFKVPDLGLRNPLTHLFSVQQNDHACGFLSMANAKSLQEKFENNNRITSLNIRERAINLFIDKIEKAPTFIMLCPIGGGLHFGGEPHMFPIARELGIFDNLLTREVDPVVLSALEGEIEKQEKYRFMLATPEHLGDEILAQKTINRLKESNKITHIIFNVGRNHWVLLSVINKNGQYEMFYLDSLNKPLSSDRNKPLNFDGREQVRKLIKYIDDLIEVAKQENKTNEDEHTNF